MKSKKGQTYPISKFSTGWLKVTLLNIPVNTRILLITLAKFQKSVTFFSSLISVTLFSSDLLTIRPLTLSTGVCIWVPRCGDITSFHPLISFSTLKTKKENNNWRGRTLSKRFRPKIPIEFVQIVHRIRPQIPSTGAGKKNSILRIL